jgi:PPOX class probable F420-dependent enzyme
MRKGAADPPKTKGVLLPAQEAFLQSARVGRLATSGSEGQPHLVPICFALEGGLLYTPIDGKPKRTPAESLRRIRNIRQNPRVAFLVDLYEEDWSRLGFVLVEGEAEILKEGEEFERAVRLLRRKYRQYERVAIGGPEGLIIRITPRRISSWGAL